jgi:ribonucleoside-diphosphate reductase alpha chain
MNAVEQLQLWKVYQDHWAEHKPSITVSVKEEEWMDVGAWVFENFNQMSGVSFLPFADHSYRQAPYQDMTVLQYNELLKKMPKNVDWMKLKEYESTDRTAGSQELACSADGCEIVDLTSV